MKVPERIESDRVLYYVPFPEPESNSPGEPDSVAWVLLEWFAGNPNTKRSTVRPQFSAFGVDIHGARIWSTEYYYLSVDDFLTDVKKHGLQLLVPGDPIPAPT